MRYVLLFSDGTIKLGGADEGSPYVVWPRNGWRAGVAELAHRVRTRNEGGITNLEIQSHGAPGRIVVDRVDHVHDIDHRNVVQFGTMLRPVMAPGGLIEILACLVAGVDRSTPVDGESQYSPEIIEAYWGGLERDPVFLDRVNSKVVRLNDDQAATNKARIAALKKKRLGRKGNGLEFCLTLARTSGAIVRAACLVQMEEIGHYINHRADNPAQPISRDFDRIGDWEGPVWDFLPSGEVKYLGCNLPRHNLRFPKHQVGPLLTYNFREQGGNSTDVGLRSQRMNRTPMPV